MHVRPVTGAGDADTMLDELGVDDEKRLKCNAHILLCIDNAIDKTFKDMETLIGVSKLISESASHVFNSPNCSIWSLGYGKYNIHIRHICFNQFWYFSIVHYIILVNK